MGRVLLTKVDEDFVLLAKLASVLLGLACLYPVYRIAYGLYLQPDLPGAALLGLFLAIALGAMTPALPRSYHRDYFRLLWALLGIVELMVAVAMLRK